VREQGAKNNSFKDRGEEEAIEKKVSKDYRSTSTLRIKGTYGKKIIVKGVWMTRI